MRTPLRVTIAGLVCFFYIRARSGVGYLIGVEHGQTLHDVRGTKRDIIRHPHHPNVPGLQSLYCLRPDVLPPGLIGEIFVRTLRLDQQSFQISVNQIGALQSLANVDHRLRGVGALLDIHIA